MTSQDVAMSIMLGTEKWILEEGDFSIVDATAVVEAHVSDVRQECAEIADEWFKDGMPGGRGGLILAILKVVKVS